jgi:hypothetical protein
MSNIFRLATKDGSHVADVPVQSFSKLPDVVMYKGQVFQFHAANPTGGDPANAEYREAFTFIIPSTTPAEPTTQSAPAAAAPATHQPAANEPHPGFDKVTDPTKAPVTTTAPAAKPGAPAPAAQKK